jgi:hypothetical protein
MNFQLDELDELDELFLDKLYELSTLRTL